MARLALLFLLVIIGLAALQTAFHIAIKIAVWAVILFLFVRFVLPFF